MHLLWLKTDLLHPVDKGGKIRTYHMLRELRKHHRVTYLALDDGSAAPNAVEQAEEYCHEVIRVPHRSPDKLTPAFYAALAGNLWSPLPYAVHKYRSETFRRRLEAQQHRADLIVCDFLFPSVNLPARLARPSLLFQHNVEALIWRRHADTQTRWLARQYFHQQWRRMRAFEREACRRFDAIVAVSPQDRALLETEYGAPLVRDIPTGVDTEYFRSAGDDPADPPELVFTGSMDWLPNDDGMKYFVKDILPLIRASLPRISLTIVGRNPLPGLRALVRSEAAVHLTGRVDDVRPYMNRASVYVVPLRVGGGTRLKVFEAMAMGKPVVSTRIGVEGLPVENGADVVIADDPRSFADAVLRLLRDPALARRIGQAGAGKVRARFGWAPVADAFVEACRLALARSGDSPPVAADGRMSNVREGRSRS